MLICSSNRLLVWYSVITALFRCPSSLADLRDDSPKVCKPYLTAQSYATPYLEPYYNTYAAPYVAAARPYFDNFENQVYTPALSFGKHSYKKYGAHRVRLAREYSQDGWEKTLKPQFDATRMEAKRIYDSSLAPHISKASAVAKPYYTASRDTLSHTYNNNLYPTYFTSRLYIEKAYTVGHKIAVDTGLPYAQDTWDSAVVLVERSLWPKLRVLYGENVEPQLFRIGERLGRYRDGKKLKTAVEEINR